MDGTQGIAYLSRVQWFLSKLKEAHRGLSPSRVLLLSIPVLFGWAAHGYYVAVVGGRVLYATSSPDGKYRIEILQTRDFMLNERSVYLTAHRNGKKIVNRKLLYTGDFLDDDFRGLYPNPRWTSNSTLELGFSNENQDERSSQLKVTNEASNSLSYVIIESSLWKAIILDVGPGSTLYERFRVRGWLSCEGQYSGSNERFSGAAGVVGHFNPTEAVLYDAIGTFIIDIHGKEATINSPEIVLRPTYCCTSDRPSYEHE